MTSSCSLHLVDIINYTRSCLQLFSDWLQAVTDVDQFPPRCGRPQISEIVNICCDVLTRWHRSRVKGQRSQVALLSQHTAEPPDHFVSILETWYMLSVEAGSVSWFVVIVLDESWSTCHHSNPSSVKLQQWVHLFHTNTHSISFIAETIKDFS